MRGICYCHEHLHIDLSRIKKDKDTHLNEREVLKEELDELYKKGVSRIVEVTNRGMGRNINDIIYLEEKSNIEVLVGTGYYIKEFFPKEVEEFTAEQLAKILIEEINIGIDGTNKKASLIGEIGTSYNQFHPLEKKVFLASTIAQKESGVPISTHTSLSTMALAQIKLFEEEGINLEDVTIGHCDLRDNMDTILEIIDKGAYVQFDTIGKNSYYPDEKRVKNIIELKKRGLLNRLMLSMDITRKSHLKVNGGLGFSYLLDTFVPMLRQGGLSEKEIDMMLIENPRKFFKEV